MAGGDGSIVVWGIFFGFGFKNLGKQAENGALGTEYGYGYEEKGGVGRSRGILVLCLDEDSLV